MIDSTLTSENQAGILQPAPTIAVWDTLARVDLKPAFWPDLEDADQAAFDARIASAGKQAAFVQSKRKGIETLLLRRHGGQCNTDDGEVWLEAAIPYVIEAADIVGHSAIIAGLKWGRKFCPLVPLDYVAGLVNASLTRRDDAAKESQITGRHVQWLPTGQMLLQDLRPTWEEVTGLKLRGFASIDPPSIVDRRVRKTDQRRHQRHENGVKPRSTLLRTKCAERLAVELSVSLSTIKRMRRSEGVGGPTDLRIAECAERDPKMSPANVEPIRGDTFGSFVDVVFAGADVVQPQADASRDDMTETNTLMQDGYTGRNLTLSAADVERLGRKFPRLKVDIVDHLARADERMNSAPKFSGNKVLLNLLRYWNKGIGDARQAA